MTKSLWKTGGRLPDTYGKLEKLGKRLLFKGITGCLTVNELQQNIKLINILTKFGDDWIKKI